MRAQVQRTHYDGLLADSERVHVASVAELERAHAASAAELRRSEAEARRELGVAREQVAKAVREGGKAELAKVREELEFNRQLNAQLLRNEQARSRRDHGGTSRRPHGEITPRSWRDHDGTSRRPHGTILLPIV